LRFSRKFVRPTEQLFKNVASYNYKYDYNSYFLEKKYGKLYNKLFIFLNSFAGSAAKNGSKTVGQSSSIEKLEEEKKKLVVRVRHLESELRSAGEKEQKTSEKSQVLERKIRDLEQNILDLQHHMSSDKDSSQVNFIWKLKKKNYFHLIRVNYKSFRNKN
jgi:hypothetical protein